MQKFFNSQQPQT
jgi:hypothetical protein